MDRGPRRTRGTSPPIAAWAIARWLVLVTTISALAPAARAESAPPADRSASSSAPAPARTSTARTARTRGRVPLPPLRVRLHEDSLRFVAGVTPARWDSLNTAFLRDVADARRERDDFALSRLLTFQGAGYAMIGDALHAAPALDEAIPITEAAADTAWLMITLRWRAYTAGMLGRLDEQQRFAARLVTIAEAESSAKFLAIGHSFLGWIARQRGDLRQARVYLERAVEGERALHDEAEEAFARTAYGATLADLGEYAAARRSYARQLEIARRLKLSYNEAQAYNDLGVLEKRGGDPGRSVDYFRRAYEVLRQRGETPDAVAALINLTYAEMSLGRATSAADMAREGLEICARRGFGRLRGNLLVASAGCEEMLGHEQAAEATWRRIVALGDSVAVDTRAFAILGLSRALQRSGRSAEGLALVDESAKSLLPRLGRDMAAQYELGWADRLVRAGRHADALAIAQRTVTGPAAAVERRVGSPAWETIAVCQRGLGRPAEAKVAFDSACAVWERQRGRPADPEWRSSVWASPGSLRLAYTSFLLSWPPAEPETTRIGAAYARLQQFRSRTLLEQVTRDVDVSGVRSFEPSAPWTATRIQHELLGKGDVLLEWAVESGQSYLFAFTRDQRRVFTLADPAKLWSRIQSARDLLAAPPRSEIDVAAARAVAQELARIVFGPALPMVEHARSIILVPDGPLHLVPFSALATASGPLGESHTMAIAPSVAVLGAARLRSSAPPPGRGLLAVASGGGEGRLVGAEREVAWLVSAFEGVERPGAPAGEPTRFASSLSPYDALHFAGHTTLDDRFPWRSGIDVGALASAEPEDEPPGAATRAGGQPRELLRAETIAATPLAARLVVLSSCETAAGRIVEGEGVSGLSTAFLAAGARSVVASLWPVNDQVTEVLMREFYRALASGKPAAAALQKAQERVRQARETRHPYYWAGFVLLGDGATTLPLTPTRFWHRTGKDARVGVRPTATGGAPGGL